MLWKDLFEAPLADFGSFGDPETAGSFRTDDLRALRNPKWHEKLYRTFRKTPYNFNVYVYNAPDAMAPVGRDRDRGYPAGDPVKVNDIGNLHRYVGIQPLRIIEQLIGRVPPDAETSITVVLVENEGDGRVALTPWILAHRVVHAMFYAAQIDPLRGPRPGQDPKISSAAQEIFTTYNSMFNTVERMFDNSAYHGHDARDIRTVRERSNRVAKLITTFRSGRLGNLSNPGEFVIETVTQYLVQGKVAFQRPTLDDAGRTSPLDPAIDADLLTIARGRDGQYLNKDAFVRAALATKYRIKNPPRKPDLDRVSFTAFDPSGQAIASFGPDRVEKYRVQGYRVEQASPPSRQAIARYNTYVRRVNELESMYDEWREAGLLRRSQTDTDLLDSVLDRCEAQFNQQIAKMLDACVGKAVIL